MSVLYYQMPKFLFEADKYKSIEPEGKIIFSVLMDRMKLSEHNGLRDDLGVYCFMSREEMAEISSCGITAVRKYLKQLTELGLIFERRQGQGRPNKLYLVIPEEADQRASDQQKNKIRQSENDILNSEPSECSKNEHQDNQIPSGNINNMNNTEVNKSKSISRDAIERMLKDRFRYDLFECDPAKHEMADTFMSILVDVFMSNQQTVRIHKKQMNIEVFKSVIMKMDDKHLDYAIDQIYNAKVKINGNPVNYMLTCLYESYFGWNLFFNKTYNGDSSAYA